MSTLDQKMTFDTIAKAFEGDNSPEIKFSQLGRIRLVNALSRKYGSQFRNDPLAKDAIRAFDSEMDFATQLKNMRGR